MIDSERCHLGLVPVDSAPDFCGEVIGGRQDKLAVQGEGGDAHEVPMAWESAQMQV